jgi:hypothetical protein
VSRAAKAESQAPKSKRRASHDLGQHDTSTEQRIRNSERIRQEAFFGDVLVKATDRLGEMLANIETSAGSDASVFDEVMGYQVQALHALLWEARWEMGLGGGKRVAYEAEAETETAEGGAS